MAGRILSLSAHLFPFGACQDHLAKAPFLELTQVFTHPTHTQHTHKPITTTIATIASLLVPRIADCSRQHDQPRRSRGHSHREEREQEHVQSIFHRNHLSSGWDSQLEVNRHSGRERHERLRKAVSSLLHYLLAVVIRSAATSTSTSTSTICRSYAPFHIGRRPLNVDVGYSISVLFGLLCKR